MHVRYVLICIMFYGLQFVQTGRNFRVNVCALSE